MTAEQAREIMKHLPEVKALAEGKEIEIFYNGGWKTIRNPSLEGDYDGETSYTFRVKPEAGTPPSLPAKAWLVGEDEQRYRLYYAYAESTKFYWGGTGAATLEQRIGNVAKTVGLIIQMLCEKRVITDEETLELVGFAQARVTANHMRLVREN